MRYCRNNDRLARLGFHVARVKGLYRYPAAFSMVLAYEALPGVPLSDLLDQMADGTEKRAVMLATARYYSALHRQGVYCRPTHFRNIIVDADRSFGLIDVQNIRFWPLSLSLQGRARNFRHIFKYPEHRRHLKEFGVDEFMNAYMDASGIAGSARERFMRHLRRRAPSLFSTP